MRSTISNNVPSASFTIPFCTLLASKPNLANALLTGFISGAFDKRLNVLSTAFAEVVASLPAVNKVEPNAARFLVSIFTIPAIPEVSFKKLIISVPLEIALSSK